MPIGLPTWSRRPTVNTYAPLSAASGAPSGPPRRGRCPSWPRQRALWPFPLPRASRASDRALLLLGFAGVFRRSELVALDVADLEETEDGFKITIRRSKTDQEGHGVTIAIARGVTACPVKAVKAWLQAAGITEGPIFRPVAKGGRLIPQRLNAEAVCDVVQTYAKRLGLKAADFGGHSPRVGFLISAARRGCFAAGAQARAVRHALRRAGSNPGG
jgi:integrase